MGNEIAEPSALAGIHRGLGAELMERAGHLVPLHYGDPERELAAAGGSAVLVHRVWRGTFRVGGEERIGFLERMLTSDIEGVEAGSGCRALLLDQKGKVVADMDLWIDQAGVVGATDVTVLEPVLATLQRYILRSPVVLEDRSGQEVVLGLGGPRAEDVLAAMGCGPLHGGPRAHGVGELAGVRIRMARTPSFVPPGFELLVPRKAADRLWEASLSAGKPAALQPMGWTASEVLRVEAGRPAHGAELTGAEFPQEAALERAIDFEKGCYLGQETVARIHYRGHVNRRLVALSFDREASPGAQLHAGDREVGTVTSAVVSLVHGPIGLGYVRREHAESGVALRVTGPGGRLAGGDGTATVAARPFDAPG